MGNVSPVCLRTWELHTSHRRCECSESLAIFRSFLCITLSNTSSLINSHIDCCVDSCIHYSIDSFVYFSTYSSVDFNTDFIAPTDLTFFLITSSSSLRLLSDHS